MENAIEVENLTKTYGGFHLGVSFTVPVGCVTGFVGANGAGKSTTVRLLLGLTRGEGVVRFWGKDMRLSEREVKDRIGFVTDDCPLFEQFTLREMKAVVARSYSTWDEKIFGTCIDFFELDPGKKVGALSKGMRTKFALSLALSHHADLLIMDEPTGGLDPLVRKQFTGIVGEFMKHEGKSVLFSTHIVSDLERVADTLLLIDNGSIVLTAEKDALLDSHRLVKGKIADLSDKMRELLLSPTCSDYGFSGITAHADEVKRLCPNAVCERTSLEEIMLAYMGDMRK